MNAWPLAAWSLHWGLRAATLARVRMIDEGGVRTLGETGAVVIVANHQSHADTSVLHASLPPNCRRRVRFVASATRFRRADAGAPLRERLERWLLHGLAVRAYGAVLVGGDESGLRSIDTLSRLLAQGAAVAMYPEGTRAPGATLGKLKPGVAMLALATGCRVVPIRIDGTRDALPKSSRFPRFGARITLRARPPLIARAGESHADFLARIARSLEAVHSDAPREARP